MTTPDTPSFDTRADFGLELGDTERRIVDSARHCFETLGVRGTRIEDIAAQANLSRQTVYKYFGGKEDIVDRIGLLEMAKVNEEIRAQIGKTSGFAEKITEAIVVSVEISRENPYLRRTIGDAELMPRYPNRDAPLFRWQRTLWDRFLLSAQARGELAADLGIDEVVRWILLSQLMLLLACERGLIDPAAMRDLVRRLVVQPLLGQERLAGQPGMAAEIAALRDQNRALKELVSQQALELFALRKPG